MDGSFPRGWQVKFSHKAETSIQKEYYLGLFEMI